MNCMYWIRLIESSIIYNILKRVSSLKVKMFDPELLLHVKATVGIIFGTSASLIGFLDIDAKTKYLILISVVIASLITYIIYFFNANSIKHLQLNYGESSIEIKKGDIFSDIYKNDETIRVFAFNEYFDTQVDNKIISKKSLNGQILGKEINDVNNLNNRMKNDTHLNNSILGVNSGRAEGKKTKYKLGTVFKYSENIFFTAMTHFDNENRANLSVQEYIRFLINFWDEINTMYAGNTVVIPLLGSGITRLDQNIYNSNQILEMILWTFYLRRIKFKKPSKLIILMDNNTNKAINYYKIRGMFNGLQK